MEQALEGGDVVHRMKPGRKPQSPKPQIIKAEELLSCDSKAAAYAVRVWNGQSPDVPVAERIERVMNALRGQNLLTDGLTFPPIDLPT